MRIVLVIGTGALLAGVAAGARGKTVVAAVYPHVWLDPIFFQRFADRIGAALGRRAAARRFDVRLRELDGAYRRGLARCAHHDIVTSHAAFGYLGRRYGLRQIALTGLDPEAEPAPRALARAIELVRRTHATTIFFEKLIS